MEPDDGAEKETMTRRHAILSVLAVVFGMAQQIGAAEIRGHVQTSAGDTAAIIVDGDSVPSPGDAATIFFKLPGTDDEVLVATGKVTGVAGDSVTVKIDDAKGKVEKGQLARIVSDNPQKRSGPAAASSPAVPAPEAETIRASLVGRWAGSARDGLKGTVVFKEDGTVVMPLQQTRGAYLTGKYSIDSTSKPPRVVITNIEVVPPPQLTDAELKNFQLALDQVRNFKQPVPDPDAKYRARHLSQPVTDAFLRSTWIGEIDDPTHIRIQGFAEAEAAAHPKLGPEAGVLTKLGVNEEGPIADFHPTPISASALTYKGPSEAYSPSPSPAQSETPGPRRGKLILTEDFSKTSPRTTEKGGTIEHVGGELHMTALRGMLISPISSEKLRDFYAEWSMRIETIPRNSTPGILLRMSMENKILSSSGVVLIDQDEHGNRLRFYCTDKTGLASYSDQDLLREGLFKQKEKNQLGVEVSGQTVRVFVNNTLACTFASEKLPADGLIAFVVQGANEEPCSVYFDDLRVYTLAASSTEPPAK
jgi:hypothetical protein